MVLSYFSNSITQSQKGKGEETNITYISKYSILLTNLLCFLTLPRLTRLADQANYIFCLLKDNIMYF